MNIVNQREKVENEEKRRETIILASRVPDAKGLEEIQDPFLKAKVADALDTGRDAQKMYELGKILALKYPRASDKVLRQARYLRSLENR